MNNKNSNRLGRMAAPWGIRIVRVVYLETAAGNLLQAPCGGLGDDFFPEGYGSVSDAKCPSYGSLGAIKAYDLGFQHAGGIIAC